jgi:hypothetical protein
MVSSVVTPSGDVLRVETATGVGRGMMSRVENKTTFD